MEVNTYPFMDQRVTSEQALQVAADYIALAFNRDDRPTPRHSIPVQADDHDMVLTRYIKQTAALLERAEALAECVSGIYDAPYEPLGEKCRAFLRDLRDGRGS